MIACEPCGRPFGQFVTDLSEVCRLATSKGNVLAVRVLASRAAEVLLILGRGTGLTSGFLRSVGEDLSELAAQGNRVPDNSEPKLVWSPKELQDICSAVSAADKGSATSTNPDVVAARTQLLRASDQIQEILAPKPGLTPTPVGPGVEAPVSTATVIVAATGLAALAASVVMFFTRRRAA